MSTDELMAKLVEIRHKRTTPPPVSVRKRPAKEAAKSEAKVDKLVQGMSEADKQLLLKMFKQGG